MVLANLGKAEEFGMENYHIPVAFLGRPTEKIPGAEINQANNKTKRDFMLDIERLSKNKVNASLYNPHKDTFKLDARSARFPISKEKKTSYFEQHAQRKAYIPGPT